jgi:predicted N-acetyltransferase YhbS
MTVVLREANAEDAAACGQICHDAFEDISEQHRFPKDIPSREAGVGITEMLISHPGFYAVVAEQDGVIIGSNFLDERSPIRGVGPITVDPAAQNSGAGGELMRAVLDRADRQGAAGVRLLQDTFHNRSLVLYTKLGFRARATTAVMQGPALEIAVPGHEVRAASEADITECNRVCESVHGHDRGGELADAIRQGTAMVSMTGDQITGYTTGVAFFGHSVGQSDGDLAALIAESAEFGGAGFHVPTHNDALLRWCLDHGLRMVKGMTLMTRGLYNEPQGAYLPSVLY